MKTPGAHLVDLVIGDPVYSDNDYNPVQHSDTPTPGAHLLDLVASDFLRPGNEHDSMQQLDSKIPVAHLRTSSLAILYTKTTSTTRRNI